MSKPSLNRQIYFATLAATFIPLFGILVFTLQVLEASVIKQVQAGDQELARAGAALVSDYLKDATTKLKSIAQMVRKDQDPQEQTKRLNALLDPPDIFLEVGYWTLSKGDAEVQAQAQQLEYNLAQTANKPSNRAFSPRVKQQVPRWAMNSPILADPAAGKTFLAPSLENVGQFKSLPISVPAQGGAVLTANVDFNPITNLLTSLTPPLNMKVMTLSDSSGERLAVAGNAGFNFGSDELKTSVPVGHAGWQISIHQLRSTALKPVDELKRRWWFVSLAGLILSNLVAGILTRIIAKPIRSLARSADALRKGDLSVRTGMDREDEIGQLARTFDRMAEAVQKLDHMKSEFVSHVSHELRTPLTSAKVTLANVQEGIGGKDALERVQLDLDRLIRMVNELLDIARIEAGLQLAKQKTNLGDLAASAAESLRPLAKVDLKISGRGDDVDLDPARVQQIVVNLVDNALKYAKTRVDVVTAGREVRVVDDGPGVPPEHRERIFEKFSKVETGPKPPGAGLGLSIARKLAQLHGATLTCEGNAFVLRF